MAGDPRLYTPRSPLLTGRASLYSPGYTPLPRLRRVTEEGQPRVLETMTDYRVSERNTVIASQEMDCSISQLTTEATEAQDTDLYEVAVDNGNGTFSSAKQTRSTLLSGKADQADLDAHEADTTNPHAVTAAQVGAPTTAELTAHTANTSNPHSVTKAQVGLSNVDNTADSAKPVSTATQSALDGKVDKVSGKGLSTEDYTTPEKTKLAGIEAGAEVNEVSAADIADYENTTQLNARDTANRSRANHTGTQSADTITDGTTNKAYTATEKTKLSGIATGATANSSDATLLDRTNHTGSQAISTVTGLQTALDAKLEDVDVADINATGTPSDTTYLRGDGSCSTPVGGGGGAVDSVNGATGVVVLGQDDVLDGTTYKQYSATEKTKLAGIASGATANDTDSNLKNRANHTGSQTASTISDFQTTVSANTDVVANSADRHSHANSAVLDATTASFTTADETKLDGIEAGAEVNISEINDAATTTTNTWSADKISTEIAAGGGGGTTLPDQTGNSGKYLKTDGSALSWDTPAGGGGGSSFPITHITMPYEAIDGFRNGVTGTAALTQSASGGYIRLTTGATSGSLAYIAKTTTLSPPALPLPWYGSVLGTVFNASSGDGKAIFCFQARNINIVGNTNQDHSGIYFEKVTGTTAFYSSTADGTTHAKTALSGAAINTPIRYSYVYNADNTCDFYVDGVLKNTHSTNLHRTSLATALSVGSHSVSNSSAHDFGLDIVNSTFSWEDYS